jgi:hypothetical protein
MKKFLFGMILLLASCALASSSPPRTQFTAHVTDAETGNPITNVIVKTLFQHQYDPFNSQLNKVDRQEKAVDKEGYATFSGMDLNGSVGATVHAAGYYQDWAGMERMKLNRILNRWEPWDPVIEVKMRKIKNPVPMVYKGVLRKKVPVKEGRVGFDLEAADWVEPYGKGKMSDFIFILTPVTEPKQGIKYSMVFKNPLDGIQEYIPAKESRSEYIFPYEAPTNGYHASLNKYRLLYYPVIPDYPANNLKDNAEINYIFRVRTKVNDAGNIISANYGRIKGEVILSDTPLIDLQYWFNPEPNSRSLESNKKPY